MATVSGLNINGTGYDIDAKTFNGYSTGAFASSGHTHSEYQTTAAMTGYSTTGHTHDNLTRRQSCYSSSTYSTGYFLLAQWKGGSGTGNHDASIAGVFTQGGINYEFKAGARASGATVNSKYNYVNATTDMLVITYEVDTSNNNRIILRVYSKITANWQRSVVYINAVTNADMYTPSNINSSDLTLPGTYSTTIIGTAISQSVVVGSHTHDYAAKNGNYSANGLIAASASYSDGVYWSYGTSNLARPVGFAWGDSKLWKDNAAFSSSIVYDANFAYNPTTHVLTVSSIDCSIPVPSASSGIYTFTGKRGEGPSHTDYLISSGYDKRGYTFDERHFIFTTADKGGPLDYVGISLNLDNGLMLSRLDVTGVAQREGLSATYLTAYNAYIDNSFTFEADKDCSISMAFPARSLSIGVCNKLNLLANDGVSAKNNISAAGNLVIGGTISAVGTISGENIRATSGTYDSVITKVLKLNKGSTVTGHNTLIAPGTATTAIDLTTVNSKWSIGEELIVCNTGSNTITITYATGKTYNLTPDVACRFICTQANGAKWAREV